MADYVIGDVQGCYDVLCRLLDLIQFNPQVDKLYFVGDLVNRGPQSLEVLRFVKANGSMQTVLGNHDLHLLHQIFIHRNHKNKDDTLVNVLNAPDVEELGHWLRCQPILHFNRQYNTVITHAGIAPVWSLQEAQKHAEELHQILSGNDFQFFLKEMYGNEPSHWHHELTGIERLRIICNYFTRMRFCNEKGDLVLSFKGKKEEAPPSLYAWFEVPHRVNIDAEIIFGHWAALEGITNHYKIHAIDTGCVWGNQLTAFCLQNKKRFAVSGVMK